METNNILVKSIGKHSVHKFDLIENYVKSWSQKLMNNQFCSELVFIDCMCNCGEYICDGKQVLGTPVRIANLLRNVSFQYPHKKISLYFNDIDGNKINYLSKLLPANTRNFSIHLSANDGNEMIENLGRRLFGKKSIHYLLVYDPFEATIDWQAIKPFLNQWGEVIINHMVSDSVRAVKMAKSEEAIEKYEKTYQCSIEELIPFGSDKSAYEKRVSQIIKNLRFNEQDYHVASFPFFNSKNAIVYDLIFCTSNFIGFKLFKECAWKVFGGHSSNKKTYGNEIQYTLDFENNDIKIFEDSYCYSIHNIVDYIYENFKDKGKVPLKKVWEYVDMHPIFSTANFKTIIKNELKNEYDLTVCKSYIIFGKES